MPSSDLNAKQSADSFVECDSGQIIPPLFLDGSPKFIVSILQKYEASPLDTLKNR